MKRQIKVLIVQVMVLWSRFFSKIFHFVSTFVKLREREGQRVDPGRSLIDHF